MSSLISTGTYQSTAPLLQHESLLKPVDAFVSRCGKRIRQALVQCAFEIAGGEGVVPVCLSSSIEMLHAGSLVIDDIQDDSSTRRGRPTLHRDLGVPLAINAGNWMYFDALHQLTTSALKPRMRGQLLSRMVAAGKRCHEGQACDLAARIDKLPTSKFYPVVRCISREKTGCLVSLAMQFGAIAAAADRDTRRMLARFGMQIGVALQMRNDLDELLSLIRDPYETLRSDDLRNARVTWPWAWMAMHGNPLQTQRLIDQTSRAADDPEALVHVAKALLSVVYSPGNKIIGRRIERELDRLRPVAINETAIEAMTIALQPISMAGNHPIATEPAHVHRV